MGAKLKRRNVGSQFSEGARRWWIELRRQRLTIAEASARIGAADGMVSRWIYGDRVPSIEWMMRIAAAFPAVALELWGRRPARRFLLPAARAAA